MISYLNAQETTYMHVYTHIRCMYMDLHVYFEVYLLPVFKCVHTLNVCECISLCIYIHTYLEYILTYLEYVQVFVICYLHTYLHVTYKYIWSMYKYL
jgi:hypothetical protein